MKLRQFTIGLGFFYIHKWLNVGVRHPFCYVHVDNVVDGSNFKNFIKVIMNAYLKNGGLTKEEISKKMLCFDANGVNVFKGQNKSHYVHQGISNTFFHGCSLCCT
jgi:hypothetical protein